MTRTIDDVIRKLSIQLTTASVMEGRVPEKLYEYENEAKAVLKAVFLDLLIKERDRAWLGGGKDERMVRVALGNIREAVVKL